MTQSHNLKTGLESQYISAVVELIYPSFHFLALNVLAWGYFKDLRKSNNLLFKSVILMFIKQPRVHQQRVCKILANTVPPTYGVKRNAIRSYRNKMFKLSLFLSNYALFLDRFEHTSQDFFLVLNIQ